MACFPSRGPQKTFLWPILLKKRTQFPILAKKHWLTPSEKGKIFDFLNRCFYSLKWLVSYLEGHKTLSFRPTSLKKKKGQNC